MNPLVPINPLYDAPLVVTYLGSSLSGMDIGPARSDRIIVAVGFGENDAGGSMSSLTLNGVSASVIYNPTVSDSFSFSYAVVPTGTTLTAAWSQFGGTVMHFWMVTGYKTGLYNSATNSSGSTSLSNTSTAPAAKSGYVMASRSRSSSGSFATTASGGVVDTAPSLNFGYNFSGGGNPSIWGSCGLCDKSGSNITVNHTGSSNFDSGLGTLAVFY